MSIKTVTLEESVEILAKALALEMSKLIDGHGGPTVNSIFASQFIAAFVAARACRSLSVDPQVPEHKRYDASSKAFLGYLNQTSEAVSAGFTAAMSQFSGQTVEYYCQIKLVPEVASSSIN